MVWPQHVVRPVFVLLLILVFASPARAAGDLCAVCEKEIRFTVYTREDQITHELRFLCGDCRKLSEVCYLCGLPVLRGFIKLPDGRAICEREARTAVLDEAQALTICEQVREDMDRQFLRFLQFPQTNVTVQLMDRVRLQELYKIIGNDFSCPNTLGCTETKSRAGRPVFTISLLAALPKETLMTTCIHEYAHTWVIENVPPARQRTLGKDAVEGFCELLAYLFAEQHGLMQAKSNLVANHYTRGQIHLFVATHQQYGLGDIVDWMKSGEDQLLQRDDLSRVRRLQAYDQAWSMNNRSAARPSNRIPAKSKMASKVPSAAPQLPDKLILQGIIWSKTQPVATINGRNFSLNQETELLLRDGTLLVRCLEIEPNAVVLQTNNALERLVLRLK
jgi:hypothetical protein